MDFARDPMATMRAFRRSPARLLLLGAAAVPAAGLLAPPVLRLAAWGAPRAYAAALTWLTPPYLYFVVNGIILTIAAASRFQKGGDGGDGDPPEYMATAKHEEEMVVNYDERPKDVDVAEIAKEAAVEDGERVGAVNEEKVGGKKAEEAKVSRWGSGEIPTDFSDTPTVSWRFGGRRTAKTGPTGNPLKVARPRGSETLESTWKMITEGRPVPLARHLKRSDAWEMRNAKAREQLPSTEVRRVAAPLWRQPSPGQEELNKRAEAFIQRINEEMRLEREKSLQRYWDLIRGGR